MSYQAKRNGDTVELMIYDEIGKDFFGEGVTAKSVCGSLSEAGKVSTIVVRLNSPGGVVSEGHAIYNALVRHAARVVVEVDGLAASAASVIAMAGDEIRVAENACLMIHESWAFTQGPAEDHRAIADILDKLNGTIATVYSSRTGKGIADVRAMMKKETWMNAKEALALGFATSVTPAKSLPKASWDGSKLLGLYKHAPARSATVPTARNAPLSADALAVILSTSQAVVAARPNQASATTVTLDPEDRAVMKAMGKTEAEVLEAKRLWGGRVI